jgi:hypothetical protein
MGGQVVWLEVWWTNSNPKIVLSYYLDWVERFGCQSHSSFLWQGLTNHSLRLDMPLVTQSDPGTENFGIANGHTALRQWHDPDMAGTLCHRWMSLKKNIIPEITWRQYRRRFAPGFEDILEYGILEGIYDPRNPLEKYEILGI